MSMLATALMLSLSAPAAFDRDAGGTGQIEKIAAPEPYEKAALAWLRIVDEGDRDESYAATSSAFRTSVSQQAWSLSSRRRAALGSVTKRKPVSYDSMDFDGQTYVFVVFVTDFESRAGFTERVTLETEGGTLKVNYYELD